MKNHTHCSIWQPDQNCKPLRAPGNTRSQLVILLLESNSVFNIKAFKIIFL